MISTGLELEGNSGGLGLQVHAQAHCRTVPAKAYVHGSVYVFAGCRFWYEACKYGSAVHTLRADEAALATYAPQQSGALCSQPYW